MPIQLILASSSLYRKALLSRLQLSFVTDSPDINEQAMPDELPQDLVRRLSMEKAQAVAQRYPDALIIGSDQVACIGDNILGKPGNREKAIQQLMLASGSKVTFYTGLCLYNSATQRFQLSVDPFYVHFRDLSQQQIERYIDKDKPFNCAGSFKMESLGISLFKRLEGTDPNALIGLPLIRLVEMLAQEGINIP